MYSKVKFQVIYVLLLFIFLPALFIYAETDKEREARLRSELAQIEAQIKEQEKLVSELSGQRKSLERDIRLIDAQIRKAELAIKKRDYKISQLQKQIKLLNSRIGDLDEKLKKGKESLAEILRKTKEIDDFSFVELFLSREKLNLLLDDLNKLQSVKRSLKAYFADIRNTKNNINERKKILAEKKAEESRLRGEQARAKREIVLKKKKKDYILKVTKGKESEYKRILEYQKRTAADIRAELIRFHGSGVSSRSISFGEAYDYAKFAERKTGVRAALIMAIMQQESGFGNNVGGCYVRDDLSGKGVYIRTGKTAPKTMMPSNIPTFKRIVASLGKSWTKTPVSCAYVKKDGSIYGWGGAMGYTQFIPNTWKLVEPYIKRYLGVSITNPWNPKHAVMATAIFLRDHGAAGGSYASERRAACRYYGSCSYYDYGTSVMRKARSIQSKIDQLESGI